MAAFVVYKDDENQGRHVSSNFAKLKESKVDAVPRSALGEIHTNKVLANIPQGSKVFDSKVPAFKEKDVSDAFKEVKLDSKSENLNGKVKTAERLPLAEKKSDAVDESSSDISLDISASEIDDKHSYSYRIKIHSDTLYDCNTYRDDIYSYLRQLEQKIKPKPFYMKKQPDITYTMRSILVDWLVEVAEEYKLQCDTLFMAVSYVDRFLSTMAVIRSKLQLLGTSAMFVAAKYEEIYPPEVGEFTYITDDTYTKKQVLRMEQLILKTLNFDISAPTHVTFLTHLTKVANIDYNVSTLALYICELTLIEGDPYLQYAPSLIACGAIALARHCCGHVEVWPTELSRVSGYSLRHLAEILPHLNSTHAKAPEMTQTASREKYKLPKHYGVSLIPHRPLVVRNPNVS